MRISVIILYKTCAHIAHGYLALQIHGNILESMRIQDPHSMSNTTEVFAPAETRTDNECTSNLPSGESFNLTSALRLVQFYCIISMVLFSLPLGDSPVDVKELPYNIETCANLQNAAGFLAPLHRHSSFDLYIVFEIHLRHEFSSRSKTFLPAITCTMTNTTPCSRLKGQRAVRKEH